MDTTKQYSGSYCDATLTADSMRRSVDDGSSAGRRRAPALLAHRPPHGPPTQSSGRGTGLPQESLTFLRHRRRTLIDRQAAAKSASSARAMRSGVGRRKVVGRLRRLSWDATPSGINFLWTGLLRRLLKLSTVAGNSKPILLLTQPDHALSLYPTSHFIKLSAALGTVLYYRPHQRKR